MTSFREKMDVLPSEAYMFPFVFKNLWGCQVTVSLHSLTPAASKSNSVISYQSLASGLCCLLPWPPFWYMSLFSPGRLSILIALWWVVFSTKELLLIKIDFGTCYRFYGNKGPYYALYPTQAVPCVYLHTRTVKQCKC